jgi:calcineurin-like phosphoesterase family protein
MKTLVITEPDKLFFTSDLHLGHEAIMRHCKRPFKDVGEMDATILNNWNHLIRDGDTVFILGDFCWRMGDRQIMWYLEHLTGNKVLILGNHDKNEKVFTKHGITVYDGFVNMKVKDPEGIDGVEKGYQRLTLCHYAMLSWYQSHRGAWQLFGHWHNATVLPDGDEEVNTCVKEEHKQFNKLRNIQYDVGVDGNNFTPISYNSIKQLINLRLSGT